MIEALINLKEMEKRPLLTFLWAFMINSIAVITASLIQSIPGVDFGFFVVLFTIIPSVYFIVLLIKREEKREEKRIERGGVSFWDIHGKDIIIYLLYFLGLTLSFALWSFFLPSESFGVQIDKITAIRGTGALTQAGAFTAIFMNNLQVMVVAFVFSLVFGAGAIFIIVWNASVLGVFIGQFSRSLFHIPLVSAGFLLHGIPEIGGYVAAALAGGILSAAILRRRRGILPSIILDSAKLLLLGVALITLGAGIEILL